MRIFALGPAFLAAAALAFPVPAAAQTPPPCPPNIMSLGKLTRNTQKGTATLRIDVSVPGDLFFGGEETRNFHRTATGPVRFKMLVKATSTSRDKLLKHGHVRVFLDIVFLSTCDGDAIKSRTITLVKK
jgi:hypothetical protein